MPEMPLNITDELPAEHEEAVGTLASPFLESRTLLLQTSQGSRLPETEVLRSRTRLQD